MTVAELIEVLKTLPQTEEVWTINGDEGISPVTGAEQKEWDANHVFLTWY